jgi:hypothetical protein
MSDDVERTDQGQHSLCVDPMNLPIASSPSHSRTISVDASIHRNRNGLG